MARPRKWNRHRIYAAVRERGSNLTQLAREAGLEPSACRVAVCRPNTKGEEAIAAFLNLSKSDLWPDRYPPKKVAIETSTSCTDKSRQNVATDSDLRNAA